MKNRRNPKPQSRRLFVESLERREVLAGNVTATLAGGLLTVTGDAAANRVVIWQNNVTGQFSVTGQGEGGATKINNGPNNGTVLFTGPVTSIFVDSKAGADFVTIGRGTSATNAAGGAGTAAVVPGAVWVYGGTENDTIQVSVNGGTNLPTPAVIIDGGYQASGLQNDTVTIRNSFIGSAIVTTYLGDDNVNVTGSIFSAISINTGWVGSGLDNDNVTLTNVAAFGASVSMGSSGTTAALDNTLNVTNGLFGALTVVGGAGVDTVNLTFVATLNTSITLLDGNNVVLATNFKAGLTNADFQAIAAALPPLPFGYSQLLASYPGIPGSLTITSGSGVDDVRLINAAITGSLFVSMGAGNDRFRTTTVTAGWATIDGGSNAAAPGDRRSAAGLTATYYATYLNFETLI